MDLVYFINEILSKSETNKLNSFIKKCTALNSMTETMDGINSKQYLHFNKIK